MSFLDKFFNVKKRDFGKEGAAHSPYAPLVNIPLDEKFMMNFKKNGGKFLYCDSEDEIHQHYSNILAENKWEGMQMVCYSAFLEKKFENFEINYTKRKDAQALSFFSTCEYLIADTGSILVCSNQIKEKKLKELPDNFIIYATTSQLVATIGEGLRGIKYKYQNAIPNNITTIKHFEIKAEKDFMSYGSSSKNLYLLLLEDL